MRRPRRPPIEQLRTAIDCLPLATRLAMLDGVRSQQIVVGAYSHPDGVCPMLAAHRCGGRTSLIAFARAWDRFAGARRARRATTRELRVLTAHLEASVLAEQATDAERARTVAEHRRAAARRGRPGDRDRSRELTGRPGWGWLRPVRRYDEWERALAGIALPVAAGRDPAPGRHVTARER
jgi:hypothetical protein